MALVQLGQRSDSTTYIVSRQVADTNWLSVLFPTLKHRALIGRRGGNSALSAAWLMTLATQFKLNYSGF